MAYIGKTPITGNFVKLDAISVVNGQAAYTMNNGGSAFTDYENVNQFLVSLNGILQAPTNSFTVSGSTLTFASNLATGDVIDFVIILGNTLDIGTVSDSTITKVKTNFVSSGSGYTGTGLDIKGNGSANGRLGLLCSAGSHGVALESPDHSSAQSYTIQLPSNSPTVDKVIKVTSLTGSGATAIAHTQFADAGGGEWTKLLHTTASNDSLIAFNSTYITSTYQDYKIVWSNVHAASDGVRFNLHISEDNGSSFQSMDFSNQGFKEDGNVANLDSGANSPDTEMDLMNDENMGNATGETHNGDITLFDPSATDNKMLVLGRFGYQVDNSYYNGGFLGGCSNGTAAVNYVKFAMSSGNISSGEFTLYGRKIT